MKKVLISVFFILGFAGYVLFANRTDATPSVASVPTSASNLAGTEAVAGASPTTATAQPTTSPTPTKSVAPTGQYKDGTYTGSAANAYYGYVQVAAVISDGKLTDVSILEYPNDRHESVSINQRALPTLRSEAISAQSANVSGVSGASDTSAAFTQSLSSALSQARA